MPHSTDNPSYSEHVHAVINNPHIADWYFTSKLSDIIIGIDEQSGPKQDIIEGLKAKKEVLEYVDWLVMTYNYSLPNDTWTFPMPHPCALKLDDIANMDNDYNDLVNCVQYHTRCSAAYCLQRMASKLSL